MANFQKLGCQSVTITGGGEPLLHPDINALIKILHGLQIQVGLVTNGTQFSKFSSYKNVTWCRISSSDDREPEWAGIMNAVQSGPGIDWAFSHVLTRKPDWDVLGRLVIFANEHNFTHVRIVGDLLDIEKSALRMNVARAHLLGAGIDDSKVIYQDRATFVMGAERCLISLIKPVVSAGGGIYPCCGVQYAQDPPGLDYVESMRMGSLEDIDRIWGEQTPFDGSRCVRCYYDDYNSALDLLTMPLSHAEFV